MLRGGEADVENSLLCICKIQIDICMFMCLFNNVDGKRHLKLTNLPG
jgi:hypothetical protein